MFVGVLVPYLSYSFQWETTSMVHQDHKPELPEEKARLEAEGSEVREVDEGSWRIYLKGRGFCDSPLAHGGWIAHGWQAPTSLA